MIAQFSKFVESAASKNLNSEENIAAVNSHPDLKIFKFKDLEFKDAQSLVLFPKFVEKLHSFVWESVTKSSIHFHVKSKSIILLLAAKTFIARSNEEYMESLRACFDLAIYARYSSISGSADAVVEIDTFEYPIFQNINEPLIVALRFILNAA